MRRCVKWYSFLLLQATDGGSTYLEGQHWVKGKLIGTGAFCSCFLARDTRLGTMMAVKQVSDWTG